jgi:CDP-paratose 2-epimerase
MRILISGICGFVGSTLARALLEHSPSLELVGLDNFSRPGSEVNRAWLKRMGARLFHADLRNASDLESLPGVDWVVDAAANPSVLAGVDGRSSSRQLVEHNLLGTVNLLEFCRQHGAGLVLLSTSRVYSIPPLAALPLEVVGRAFRPAQGAPLPAGLSQAGISEGFSTQAPVSLYGSTKLASEALALEYGESFGLPVFVNRCGVLAGGGQFGRPDQGIFSYWIHSWISGRPLRYLGFGGQGHQVRDVLHPRDLAPLLLRQFAAPRLPVGDRVLNISGGAASALSLRQVSDWCATRYGIQNVVTDAAERPFDLPWVVLDCSAAGRVWGWSPSTPAAEILGEIAAHAAAHPEWLDLSEAH